MFSSLENMCEAWDKAGGHGSKEDRINRNILWTKYYTYIAERQKGSEACFDLNAMEVVEYLSNSGWLKDARSVLDIGAGTGVYSLAFAKEGLDITAMDMDETSLSVLKTRAVELGVSDIICENAMWENYESKGKFSMTFSSMCPAICNYNELIKMEEMTENVCCLHAVTRGSYDLHRRKLMELLGVQPKGGMTTEAIWYYNILYMMNRKPEVKYFARHYEYKTPIEDVIAQNEVYFEIFGIPREKSSHILQEYFEEKVENGLVYDESHINTALICWRPDLQK